MSDYKNDHKQILFILVMEEKLPDSNFSLKNLRGSSKIDVVSRAILSIFPNSYMNLEPKLHVIFTKDNPICLEISAIEFKEDLDEITIAAQIKALLKSESLHDGFIMNLTEIVSLEHYLKSIKSTYSDLIYLHEDGENLDNYFTKIGNTENYCFILGGRQDIEPENELLLERIGIIKVNLGTQSYLASTCLILILYEFSKR